jgi:hypothetical protein
MSRHEVTLDVRLVSVGEGVDIVIKPIGNVSLPEVSFALTKAAARRVGASLVCVSDDVEEVRIKAHGYMERDRG